MQQGERVCVCMCTCDHSMFCLHVVCMCDCVKVWLHTSRKVRMSLLSLSRVLMPEVFGKLKHLYAAGYKIAFFTNQVKMRSFKLVLAAKI